MALCAVRFADHAPFAAFAFAPAAQDEIALMALPLPPGRSRPAREFTLFDRDDKRAAWSEITARDGELRITTTVQPLAADLAEVDRFEVDTVRKACGLAPLPADAAADELLKAELTRARDAARPPLRTRPRAPRARGRRRAGAVARDHRRRLRRRHAPAALVGSVRRDDDRRRRRSRGRGRARRLDGARVSRRAAALPPLPPPAHRPRRRRPLAARRHREAARRESAAPRLPPGAGRLLRRRRGAATRCAPDSERSPTSSIWSCCPASATG